ncbi:MAG TPA: sn-glycerol-3-phosphate ABC transporter substrate-binding protein, partial [Methylomirabilota bacterium]
MSRTTTLLRAVAWASALLAVVVTTPAAAAAKTEIQWWHALQATLGERVNEIAATGLARETLEILVETYGRSYPRV